MILKKEVPDFKKMSEKEFREYQEDLALFIKINFSRELAFFIEKDFDEMIEMGIIQPSDMEHLKEDFSTFIEERIDNLKRYEQRALAIMNHYEEKYPQVQSQPGS